MKQIDTTITIGKVQCMVGVVDVKVFVTKKGDQDPTGTILLRCSGGSNTAELSQEQHVELLKLLQEADAELQSELKEAVNEDA